jgi:NAD(P)-dependent dehydrogenase (short-subunit alcohol dehydrogenase family)
MAWFSGKVALVTGAGSGIGRASALKFAHEGAKVIVSDIAAEGGHETVRLIRAVGGEATFVKTDVSQASDVEALVRMAVETYGQLNYAHNNAGIGAGGIPITELSERDFDRTISVNLKGVWLCPCLLTPALWQCNSSYSTNRLYPVRGTYPKQGERRGAPRGRQAACLAK